MYTTKNATRGHPLGKGEHLHVWFRMGSSTSTGHDLTPTNPKERIHSKDMSSETLGGRHTLRLQRYLGRPALNTFQAIISIYHMKIKFPTIGDVEKYKVIPSNHVNVMWRLCVKGKKKNKEKVCKEAPPANGKKRMNGWRKPREPMGQPQGTID
ncbi:UNVERIFIED_CONTAM: hypothetical protein Sangu_2816800 [Sesamum angustifolium]|uniref:Uncharacterized protein n=1 Tax=Sesamum angustifolium TaxID=2727405 RepID=A0AAW2IR76_9LAMI